MSQPCSMGYDFNAEQELITTAGSDNPDFQPACASVGPPIGTA